MEYCEQFTDEEIAVAYEYYYFRIRQGWGIFRIAEVHEMPPQWGNNYGAITERYVIEQLALEWRKLREGLDSK